MNRTSYRTILRSSSIMGAASVLNILSGLVRMKVAAVLLGPAGVGLIGLLQSLMQTGAQVAALGTGTVGARQVAAADGEIAVGTVRRALFWGTLGLSLIGALVFLAAGGVIADYVLQEPSSRGDMVWLALGVALSVAAGSQVALLTGLRRIADLARVQIGAGVLGTGLGVLALWLWGGAGIPAMVLAVPLVTFGLGHLYVARLGPPAGPAPGIRCLAGQWRHMAGLGAAFMLSGLVTTLAHLTVRTLVQRDLGPAALGHFQAAWMIGMTYLGFVLSAMTTDYFPRLSAVIGDRSNAVQLVNEQIEVALILCSPVLLVMLALAPWVVRLLYSADFMPAVEILRWQLLGDILKVMSWPLGYVLLASGAGRWFILSESIGMGVFVGTVALGLPVLGISATGISFLLLYVVYLPIVWLIARRRIGFRWSRQVLRQAAFLVAAAAVTDILVRLYPIWGAAVGLALALAFAVTGMLHLASHTGIGGRPGRIAARLRRLTGSRGTMQ